MQCAAQATVNVESHQESIKIRIPHLFIFSSLQCFTGKLHILCHESHESSVAGPEIHELKLNKEKEEKNIIEIYSTQSTNFPSHNR